jgi:signal transduction histidine kinase
MRTDVTKLRQILLNLLSNAVKFTDRGEIRLSVTEENDQVCFSVTDTGIGIAPEHRQTIFDAFWQVDQETTRRAGGTGLGLSVVRGLSSLLGGDVSVESTHGCR